MIDHSKNNPSFSQTNRINKKISLMKNKIKDYQWPSFFISSKQKYLINLEKKDNSKLIDLIENYFKNITGII